MFRHMKVKLSQEERIDIKQSRNLAIMELLNKRPRKKLNYKTPEQVFFYNLELENQKLALAS
ncbi:MAG: IS30 family transposase [bacterium]|jgi:IS30 family transposase